MMNAVPGSPSRGTSEWILVNHDDWTRVTVSAFYLELQKNSLLEKHFRRWIADLVLINSCMMEACDRVRAVLSQHVSSPSALSALSNSTSSVATAASLSSSKRPSIASTASSLSPYDSIYQRFSHCYDLVQEDQSWLQETSKALGIHSEFPDSKTTYGTQLIMDNIRTTSSETDGSLIESIIAIWTFRFATAQGWRLANKDSILYDKKNPLYRKFGNFLARDDALVTLVETQDLIDDILFNSDKYKQLGLINPDVGAGYHSPMYSGGGSGVGAGAGQGHGHSAGGMQYHGAALGAFAAGGAGASASAIANLNAVAMQDEAYVTGPSISTSPMMTKTFTSPEHMIENGKSIFLDMLRCMHAHLQHIVYRNTAGDRIALCDKCGRHGHEEDKCTFKGHKT